MNIRVDDTTAATSIARAFSAAQGEGFKLFFSFDYAGGGPWDKNDVTVMVSFWGGHAAHFLYKGRPLVSTFEGTERAADWTAIKYATNCYVMPPSKLPSPTTISFPPFTTSLEVGQSTGTILVTKSGTVKTSTLLKVVTVTTVIQIPPGEYLP
jgi:hypothetical protein